MALFSVITVVLDDLAGLARSHASLAAQTCRDFEWIVVDGGSRDGCRAWIQAHEAEIAWWRSEPDDGIYHAMNIGLDAASGDYLLFLNAGDALADGEVLGEIATALAGAGWPDFCYGDSWEGPPGGPFHLKPARSHHSAWYGMFTHHQAMICRRVEGVRFDPSYPIGADYAFTLQSLKKAKKIQYLARPICEFATGGCSHRYAAAGRQDQSRIRKDILNHGFIRRYLISATQLIAYKTRNSQPVLFNILRYRSSV